MIRAIRPNAMAQDDASLVAGWNIAPNIAYVLRLLPGASSCGVLLYDEGGSTLIASGAALAGTEQPCVLIPQIGQTLGMVDADLGWHLLLTTTGTESQRTIRLGPAVDLPDEIHPVYGEDALALARATAAIDAAAHYIDDITVTCPLGLGAGLGDVVSVPVDGAAVVGEVESITWTATPDGTTEQAVIRRHVAIAPEAVVEVTPITVANDTGTATHLVGTSGNVLTNDDSGLTVVAVNGMSSKVGATVDGSNGGSFTIASNGAWTFDPDGDFALLEGEETADTSVTYHASDGAAEAMATLTVTVSRQNAAPVAVNDTGETDAATTTSGNVLTNDTDADLDSLTVSQVAGSAANVGAAVAGSNGGLFTIGSDGAWSFDPDGDFGSLIGEQTATTSVTYHVSDGVTEDEGTLTVTVGAASATTPWTPAEMTTAFWARADGDGGGALAASWDDLSGNSRVPGQSTESAKPTRGFNVMTFDGGDYLRFVGSNATDYALKFGTGSFAILCVVNPAAVNRNPHIILGARGYNTGWFFGLSNNNPYMRMYNSGERWSPSPATGATLSTGLQMLGATAPRGATGKFYRNGHVLVSTSSVVGSQSMENARYVNVGCYTDESNNPVGFWLGGMHEILLIPGVVSVDDWQKSEGYLAHKWDALLGVTTLVDALPPDHPYKSAAPTL